MTNNDWKLYINSRPKDNQKCEFIMKTIFKGTFKDNKLEPTIIPDKEPFEQYIVEWRKIKSDKKKLKPIKEEKVVKLMAGKL